MGALRESVIRLKPDSTSAGPPAVDFALGQERRTLRTQKGRVRENLFAPFALARRSRMAKAGPSWLKLETQPAGALADRRNFRPSQIAKGQQQVGGRLLV